MKRLLKIVLFLVALVFLVAAGGITYLYARYPNVPPADSVKIEATPEKIARGSYLANHVTGCVPCHAVRDMTKYAVR
jgi:hypothetical protein